MADVESRLQTALVVLPLVLRVLDAATHAAEVWEEPSPDTDDLAYRLTLPMEALLVALHDLQAVAGEFVVP